MTAIPTATDDRVRVDAVALAEGVGAWFTGRPAAPRSRPAVGEPGNLSHRRPHQPSWLAADRLAAADQMGVEPEDLHLMQQVHGRGVAVVDRDVARGAELRGVDALVTRQPGRALVVLVADCIPLLLASSAGPVAAVHAGRRGVQLGVVPAALEVLADLGAPPQTLSAVLGPAIGGCCYEVPEALREELSSTHPDARAETTWGTPSLDLPAAVTTVLTRAGVPSVERRGGCTRCDPEGRWFSHRGDPTTGRQAGVVVRRAAVA